MSEQPGAGGARQEPTGASRPAAPAAPAAAPEQAAGKPTGQPGGPAVPATRSGADGCVEAVSRSAEETLRLGVALGEAALPGDLFLLEGEFGVGKTVLVQGLARGLGVAGPVTSPSFVLMVEHRGRLTLYHVDLYRLGGQLDDEMLDALADSIAAGGVCAIEWPAAVPPDLRADATTVRLAALDETTRAVTVRSPRARLLAAARAALGAG